MRQKHLKEYVNEKFKIHDENQSGFLESFEVKSLLKAAKPNRVFTQQDIKIFLKKLDLNKDGKISK